MKILVIADIHGSINGIDVVLQIASREKASKTVFCGDLFGGWSSTEEQIAQKAQSVDGVLYFVRGNNDRPCYDYLLGGMMEEHSLMYHFNRTLFFTHGDRYNGYCVPPLLKQGDAVIFGHTHVGSLAKRNGIFSLNVGSVARPRDGAPSYLVLDESGATLKHINGNELYHINWD